MCADPGPNRRFAKKAGTRQWCGQSELLLRMLIKAGGSTTASGSLIIHTGSTPTLLFSSIMISLQKMSRTCNFSKNHFDDAPHRCRRMDGQLRG